MNLVEFQKVSLSYEDNLILHDLNFSIQPGEFVGLLGPNGSGKTTLLKLMCGVLKPDSGKVLLQGKDLAQAHRKEVARMVSVLPQENYLDFPFTCLEVVLMGRSPYLKTFQWETAEDLEIARRAMEQTDSSEFANRDIRSLSGGERERVLLARALAQQPRILLLDEPTTHLDLKHQYEIYQLLQRLHIQGLTVMVVLHDINFAAQACSRVLILNEARIAADGLPHDVLQAERVGEIYGVPVNTLALPGTNLPFFFPKLK